MENRNSVNSFLYLLMLLHFPSRKKIKNRQNAKRNQLFLFLLNPFNEGKKKIDEKKFFIRFFFQNTFSFISIIFCIFIIFSFQFSRNTKLFFFKYNLLNQFLVTIFIHFCSCWFILCLFFILRDSCSLYIFNFMTQSNDKSSICV